MAKTSTPKAAPAADKPAPKLDDIQTSPEDLAKAAAEKEKLELEAKAKTEADAIAAAILAPAPDSLILTVEEHAALTPEQQSAFRSAHGTVCAQR